MKTLVIGAGVAGLYFANFCKGDVIVLEKNKQAGRKLLATGNGRCNFTNLNMDKKFFKSQTEGFANFAIEKYGNYSQIEFLNSIGILTTSLPSGRCYPQTLSARTIRDILLLNAKAKFLFEKEVKDIDFKNKLIITDGSKIVYDNLVIATGGISLPGSGSDGKIFKILEKVHKTTRLTYGITNYIVARPLSNHAKGVRVSARASLFVDGKYVMESIDDVIFQPYGLTGTAILDLSNEISYALFEKRDVRLKIDLLSAYDFDKITSILKNLSKLYPERSLKDLLMGFLNSKLIKDIVKLSNLNENIKAANLNDKQIKAIVFTMKELEFKIVDINDYENAQVTIGGIDTREIDSKTCQSKIIPNMYIIGEALDVDGACGGYNIQWAYSSARVASDHINLKIG